MEILQIHGHGPGPRRGGRQSLILIGMMNTLHMISGEAGKKTAIIRDDNFEHIYTTST